MAPLFQINRGRKAADFGRSVVAGPFFFGDFHACVTEGGREAYAMRYRLLFLAAVAGAACSAITALAEEQTIAGKSFLVQDMSSGADPTKRKISVIGKEKDSPNPLVGDPTQTGSAGGALLEIFAD